MVEEVIQSGGIDVVRTCALIGVIVYAVACWIIAACYIRFEWFPEKRYISDEEVGGVIAAFVFAPIVVPVTIVGEFFVEVVGKRLLGVRSGHVNTNVVRTERNGCMTINGFTRHPDA